ncbi:uncharacterized protein EI97DRAFT_20511 [Westerdykella ornata]|uniref:SH3 domain-containing protein n=1 Tax=Westerdykella ornata TaxID=318751 RepID=A0A6A6JZC3_WESOR|nr:uncharacterized protein EI97DRAFT_20511 [Westerdykella ornata]KAF2281116.1 hypothetical protein EI97DRAFT_20511 [Westerdykella ornata]
MTRPQIIRADTLDLQDKASPTAQDHSRQPQQPAALGVGAAAPHQQSTLRQVDHERHSEEARLRSSTWSDADTLNDGPCSDDDRTVVNGGGGDSDPQRDEQAVRLNGGLAGDADDADMHDADIDEDMDDDMMDKISSSPSIDDGGYSLPFLSQRRPEQHSPSSSSLSTYEGSSSPFTATPLHLPLPVTAAQSVSYPAGGAATISQSSQRSYPVPFLLQSYARGKRKSEDHHRGEYNRTSDDESTMKGHKQPRLVAESPTAGRLRKMEARLETIRDDSQMSLMSELDEGEVQRLLQPMRNLLASKAEPLGESGNSHANHDGIPKGDDDEWVTDSDADSWDMEAANDDESNDVSFSEDPRYVDSGWGGECLRETEDIDFEFVYALHTFVATVEGQANATKGDTMVLLDDSNSYWWLVRVVKDSSIGYLPAEHIETPTERLARLNKHRNIDLSATMLGDTAEKTKNPLKKAIRRRNAKTVQFGSPTYVEPSDYDYSSDDDEELFGGADPTQTQTQTQAQAATERSEVEQDESLKVEPLKVGGVKKSFDQTNATELSRSSSEETTKNSSEKQRNSEETIDKPLDPKVSRNGTLRNTDSFFKDDNAETRKITLTPNLLRDDSTNATALRERGPSLESLEKNGFADKVKDDKKKKKERKSGMLGGLFKRKDKKKGVLDSFDSDTEKRSEDFGRSSPQGKDSTEGRPSTDQVPGSPQRQPSKGKLQKPQRSRDDSPSKITKGILKSEDGEAVAPDAAPGTTDNMSSGQSSSTMRLVSPEQEEASGTTSASGMQLTEITAASANSKNMVQRQQQPNVKPRPETVKPAKQRVQLDDFDSEDENGNPFADPVAADRPIQPSHAPPTGRLSESPVRVTTGDLQMEDVPPDDIQEADPHQPPALAADTSSQETSSPISTPSPDGSPSIGAPSKQTQPAAASTENPSAVLAPSRPAPVSTKEADASPPISSESATLPAWSDSSLRSYLDDGSDIRDTLMVIHDTTGVVPVGRDHPLMSQLYVEESKTLEQLNGSLDLLLTRWLEEKRRRHKGGAPVRAR